MDRLPQEEWHRLRRALPWVAISSAPNGAGKGCRGVLHPRLTPWATILHACPKYVLVTRERPAASPLAVRKGYAFPHSRGRSPIEHHDHRLMDSRDDRSPVGGSWQTRTLPKRGLFFPGWEAYDS